MIPPLLIKTGAAIGWRGGIAILLLVSASWLWISRSNAIERAEAARLEVASMTERLSRWELVSAQCSASVSALGTEMETVAQAASDAAQNSAAARVVVEATATRLDAVARENRAYRALPAGTSCEARLDATLVILKRKVGYVPLN